ncbi:MAG TPA: hypothetical protein VF540_12820 [Segetibacter sp.]|jgi:hypothetical protein
MRDVLPLTGKDIIEKLKIAPGPKIGELLVKAQEIYNESPCHKEELLQKLEQYR